MLGCVALAAGASTAGCAGPASGSAAPSSLTTVWGAGPALEFPIYEEVGSDLLAKKITLDYQETDPSTAIAEFRAGRVAFAVADDGAVPPGLPRRGATNAQAVPVARWAVAVVYDLPSVHAHLRLDGRTLADVYSGVVKNWNSSEIARENPGVKLPGLPIRVVHRADPAVATALITRYMAAASKPWRQKFGSGTTIRWPGGTPTASDAAMAATVAQNVGAIGYTEQNVALLDGLSTAALRNATDAFVAPSAEAVTIGKYPVLAQAYLLTYRDLCAAGFTPGQAGAVRAFGLYLLGQGQAVVKRMWFSPLPGALRLRASRQIAGLLCGSQQIA